METSELTKTVEVRYWTYLNDPKKFEKPMWYCWVWPHGELDFLKWMTTCCPTAECILRHPGSGIKKYSVSIYDEKESIVFQLRWNPKWNPNAN